MHIQMCENSLYLENLTPRVHELTDTSSRILSKDSTSIAGAFSVLRSRTMRLEKLFFIGRNKVHH